ncbi:MAG: hypothetical protein Q7S97_15045 [Polaromonas sp.]|nr:hypothetical protein [Polaromonas sp.]
MERILCAGSIPSLGWGPSPCVSKAPTPDDDVVKGVVVHFAATTIVSIVLFG